MPTICGYTWSAELDAIIREEAERNDVPPDIAYTFIAAESSFDATIVVPEAAGGFSYGLLQLYDHGQGAGYPPSELLNPRRNLQIGLPYIHNAILQSWRADIEPYEYIYLVATRSGHPGQVDRFDARILRIAQIWSCFGHGVALFGPGGIPSATAGPGPGVGLGEAMTMLLAPGMPVQPASVLAGHMGSAHIAVVVGRVLLRVRIRAPFMGPRTLLRRQMRALSPAGLRRRLIASIDPRQQLSRAFHLPIHISATRLPPRHRHPRY